MISAIILAAGESKRMGRPKMLMPWGRVTVLEHVVSLFQKAGVEDIVVVLGGERQKIESIISQYLIRCIHNEDYSVSEMLSPLQCGLKAIPLETQATLIGLDDPPQAQEGSVRLISEPIKIQGTGCAQFLNAARSSLACRTYLMGWFAGYASTRIAARFPESAL